MDAPGTACFVEDGNQDQGKGEHDRQVTVQQISGQGKGFQQAGQPQDHEQVKHIGTDDITDQQAGFIMAQCGKAGGQLGQGGADGGKGQADNQFTDTKITGQVDGSFDKEIGASGK